MENIPFSCGNTTVYVTMRVFGLIIYELAILVEDFFKGLSVRAFVKVPTVVVAFAAKCVLVTFVERCRLLNWASFPPSKDSDITLLLKAAFPWEWLAESPC